MANDNNPPGKIILHGVSVVLGKHYRVPRQKIDVIIPGTPITSGENVPPTPWEFRVFFFQVTLAHCCLLFLIIPCDDCPHVVYDFFHTSWYVVYIAGNYTTRWASNYIIYSTSHFSPQCYTITRKWLPLTLHLYYVYTTLLQCAAQCTAASILISCPRHSVDMKSKKKIRVLLF